MFNRSQKKIEVIQDDTVEMKRDDGMFVRRTTFIRDEIITPDTEVAVADADIQKADELKVDALARKAKWEVEVQKPGGDPASIKADLSALE